MINDPSYADGFHISIETAQTKLHENEAVQNCQLMSTSELGDKIAEFIASALQPQQQMRVNLIFKKWDTAFVIEETAYEVRSEKNSLNGDFARNYWIETNN
ncbi:hypothetical protein [Mucilaginibacter endophyticus]|uniref:hypothetical protein n=1 Tax=Mucilaginibacter endophyticus TaxID=2675003 RepID=UPI000E0D7279|nr:hypothetical protein [Mucilaginibacter endophyticus]